MPAHAVGERAADLTVTPALATVTTAGKQTFTANLPVTWSASVGTIDTQGTYTPPAKLSRSRVVVVTAAAATKVQAYATVVITPAEIQVAPIISVFQVGDSAQTFAASLPGSTTKPTWSLSTDVGTVNQTTGEYKPPKTLTDPATVTLTAQIDDATGSAQIVVFPAMLAGVMVTPNAATPLGPGKSQTFTAVLGGKRADVDWAVLPPIGTIDASGHYRAPQQVTAPTAALVVARSKEAPTVIGGTAVVLLAPVDGWQSGAIASPARSGHPGQRHSPTEGMRAK